MILSTDNLVVCTVLLILADLIAKGQAEDTKGTLYQKLNDTQVDKSKEFSLGPRANGRTSCVVACAAHDKCQSVNFRSGGSECMGSSKSYYSFGSTVSAESGSDNFSPQPSDVRDGDWILVFRAQRGLDTTYSERHMWTTWNNDSVRSDGEGQLSSLARDCYSPHAASCPHFFRSRWISDWPQDVLQVRLALFTGGVQKAEMIFNGSGSTRESWYNTTRLVSSTWTDMTPGDPNNYISIRGQLAEHRLFVASTTEDGNLCDQMLGWLLVDGQVVNRCPFDVKATVNPDGTFTSPQFLYSTGPTKINFIDGTYGLADVMAIFIKLK
ncbi:hypothetical protein ACOMHN_063996 [Nucella lapillus]